jgi:protein ImuA
MLPISPTADQTATLNLLLDQPGIWRGRASASALETIDSGFARLNQALHLQGLPASGLIELLCAGPCPQALRLMLPAIAARPDGLVILANPPARPRADTLQQAGIQSQRLLVMRSERQETLLQACHEALVSGAVSTLVLWLPEHMDDHSLLRRLHLAAREGRCLLVAVRQASQADRPSPAVLRLRLRVQPPAHLGIDIIKQPGGWGGQQLSLTLLPERLAHPMVASRDMPAPQQQRRPPTTSADYRDPDSRFIKRSHGDLRPGLQHLPF